MGTEIIPIFAPISLIIWLVWIFKIKALNQNGIIYRIGYFASWILIAILGVIHAGFIISLIEKNKEGVYLFSQFCTIFVFLALFSVVFYWFLAILLRIYKVFLGLLVRVRGNYAQPK